MEAIEVVVIGAGQAGTATSHELSERGVEHVVLEAERPGFSWSQRWDSFTLVTPNHAILLPGGPYVATTHTATFRVARSRSTSGRYAAGLAAEVRSGTRADRLRPAEAVATSSTRPRPSRGRSSSPARPQRPTTPAPALPGARGGRLHRLPGAPGRCGPRRGGRQSACQIAEELAPPGRAVTPAGAALSAPEGRRRLCWPTPGPRRAWRRSPRQRAARREPGYRTRTNDSDDT